MSCSDIPSLLDLQNAKKNIDDFGRLMGTGESDSTNEVTGQVRPTYNKVMKSVGFKPGSGDFTTGFTVMSGERDIAWYDPISKNWYSYLGIIPTGGHPVAPGTNPVGHSDWAPRTDETLRNELSSPYGSGLVGSTSYSGIRGYSGNATILSVYGRSDVFDGANGIFVLDVSDITSVDNDGTVLIDSLGRRWKRQIYSEPSVLWWGADRSGVSDSRQQIQNAINYCIAESIGTLVAPSGTYLINGVASSDTMLNGLLFPFSQVNTLPSDQLILQGEGGRTEFKCGSNNMILFRLSRNKAQLRDIELNGNSKNNVWGVGIVPESMSQSTTVVSQSGIELQNVGRTGLTEGIVFQPGPTVAGVDSGCFYHNINGGRSTLTTRHIWVKKPVTFATQNNRVTRTKFYNQVLTYGNTGYQFDAATEIDLYGCTEELINQSGPNATPTARIVTSDCLSIRYFGGYSEACTRSTVTPAPVGGYPVVRSYGYAFNSGVDASEWRANADAIGDAIGDFINFTPLLSATSGSPGAGTVTGYARKLSSRIAFIQITGDVGKGTLSGSLSLSGLPFAAAPASQRLPCITWGGVTTASGIGVSISGLLSGGSLLFRKAINSGAGDSPLAASEISGANFQFTLQGIYSF